MYFSKKNIYYETQQMSTGDTVSSSRWSTHSQIKGHSEWLCIKVYPSHSQHASKCNLLLHVLEKKFN